MQRVIKIIINGLLITLFLTSCSKPVSTVNPQSMGEESTQESQPTEFSTQNPEVLSTEQPIAAEGGELTDYDRCGTGNLVEVPYFFMDDYQNISPTQLIRILPTSDNVRTDAMAITCLVHEEGWQSNPDEVENGYENEIIFFDKHGKSHQYRIVIGGHYINPYDPTHKDITASVNGVDEHFFTVEEWIRITKEDFQNKGVRQIGVSIYLEDTQGNMSKVLSQTYSFRETNLQIARALQTGEGYPDQVPDGFFLFATKSWLIIPE